jgi:hypothetical protein
MITAGHAAGFGAASAKGMITASSAACLAVIMRVAAVPPAHPAGAR